MKEIRSCDPYTQTIQHRGSFWDEEKLEEALLKGVQAFGKQKITSISERLQVFLNLRTILEKDKKSLAELFTREMGKPYAQSVAEVEKCAHLCGFYAEHAPVWLQGKPVSQQDELQRVEYHPLGLILGIMPWNFPFWQVFRFAVPAVLAGNAVLLKHAPNVPLCSLKLEELFRLAGGGDAFQNLFISEAQVERLLADSRVKGVSLTGSEGAGRAVGAIAGKHLKKQVLELGGSDPFIVMPSANLENAVKWAMKSRLLNNGQSCIAAKRFILHEKIYDQFLSALKFKLRDLKFGNPMELGVDIGPLARPDLADQLRRQVQESVSLGAVVAAEYKYETDHPCFVPITVLTNIRKGMPAYAEELFGPVFSLYKVSSSTEALALANDSPYGLGASVWTTDEEEKNFFIQGLESGAVFVNAMVRSDAALPFGGIKNSGYGRELAEEGLKEFCNVKSVVSKQ